MNVYVILHNPIALIFLSYIFGALATELLKSRKWDGWFHNRNYLNDKWTNRIGVLYLGWIIRKTWLRKFNSNLAKRGTMNREAMKTLINEMTYAEMGHLIAFFSLLILNILFIIWKFNWSYIIIFFFINIILNLYLVFLQQYNKRRIAKILKQKIGK